MKRLAVVLVLVAVAAVCSPAAARALKSVKLEPGKLPLAVESIVGGLKDQFLELKKGQFAEAEANLEKFVSLESGECAQLQVDFPEIYKRYTALGTRCNEAFDSLDRFRLRKWEPEVVFMASPLFPNTVTSESFATVLMESLAVLLYETSALGAESSDLQDRLDAIITSRELALEKEDHVGSLRQFVQHLLECPRDSDLDTKALSFALLDDGHTELHGLKLSACKKQLKATNTALVKSLVNARDAVVNVFEKLAASFKLPPHACLHVRLLGPTGEPAAGDVSLQCQDDEFDYGTQALDPASWKQFGTFSLCRTRSLVKARKLGDCTCGSLQVTATSASDESLTGRTLVPHHHVPPMGKYGSVLVRLEHKEASHLGKLYSSKHTLLPLKDPKSEGFPPAAEGFVDLIKNKIEPLFELYQSVEADVNVIKTLIASGDPPCNSILSEDLHIPLNKYVASATAALEKLSKLYDLASSAQPSSLTFFNHFVKAVALRMYNMGDSDLQKYFADRFDAHLQSETGMRIDLLARRLLECPYSMLPLDENTLAVEESVWAKLKSFSYKESIFSSRVSCKQLVWPKYEAINVNLWRLRDETARVFAELAGPAHVPEHRCLLVRPTTPAVKGGKDEDKDKPRPTVAGRISAVCLDDDTDYGEQPLDPVVAFRNQAVYSLCRPRALGSKHQGCQCKKAHFTVRKKKEIDVNQQKRKLTPIKVEVEDEVEADDMLCEFDVTDDMLSAIPMFESVIVTVECRKE
eukprot:gnl/Spiro4/13218_TR7014_c0_g1_i1.p1 gnl/Spiro4/13218_TR7014_c0_g1~~gnl/Spiro4/13218_TR7014_c0_g1_i1.p1  ORF type:complete len:750 (+),score=243.62 gnl/Spiro4/13218_TR7014_c0_g1_i1:29-2278(+)